MLRTVRYLILLFLLPLLLHCRVVAQEPVRTIRFGPTIGFGIGPRSGSIPVYGGAPDCGLFEAGRSAGPSVGAQLSFPELLWRDVDLVIVGSLSRSTGSLSSRPLDRQLAVEPGSGRLVTLDREFRLDIHQSHLQLDLFGSLALGTRWSVMAGPSVGYRVALAFEQVDTILGPGGISFTGGERSRPMLQGTKLRSGGATFGGGIVIGYELPAGRGTTLLPQISLHGIFHSAADDAVWRDLTFGAGLALLIDLSPEVPPTDTIVRPESIPAPRLVAAVEINGIDEEGRAVKVAGVRVEEMFHRRHAPLVPAIFFEPGVSGISRRYLDAAPEPKDSFVIDMASDRDAVDLHTLTLDIIGFRMRGEPAATLDLFGSTSSGESPSLAEERARQVRGYLVEKWGIDATRIRQGSGEGPMRRSGETVEDGRAENRRVEFASSSPAILAPVVSERVSREFDPPLIEMTPTMKADAGIRRWSMDVRQGSELVARYRSDDTTSGEAELQWRISEKNLDSLPSPIAVELTVEDSTGATMVARDEIPVTVERRVDIVERRDAGDADRTTWSLLGFDYNVAEPGSIDRELLREIIATVGPTSRIRVVGFTDRIGDDESNRELSRRRAEQVATLIRSLSERNITGAVPISVEGGGVDTGRFSNDLPEGRILSRGVTVIVERE